MSQVSNYHLRRFLRHLIQVAMLGLACLWVLYVQLPEEGAFFKMLFQASWGVFAEWPAVWASVVVLLLAGCALYLVLALDELLPLLKRDCFSAGTFYGLMLIPAAIFSAGGFCLARALF